MSHTDEFNLAVGNRIRILRESRGYTRERFSELAEINDKYLYEVEIGKKGLSAKKLYNLANAFGVTMDFLVSAQQELEGYDFLCAMLKQFNQEELKCIQEMICGIKALLYPQKKE